MTITVDDRGKLCREVARQLSVEPSRQEWDVEWEAGVMELKTAADLCSSVSSKSQHMRSQEQRLIAHPLQAYVVVVGGLYPRYYKKRPVTVADKLFTGNTGKEHSVVLSPNSVRGFDILMDTNGTRQASPVWTYTNYMIRLQEKDIRVVPVYDLTVLGKVIENIVKRSLK